MALISLARNINSYFDENQDPRVSKWVSFSSPLYTLGICLFYLYYVKVLGPGYMKNRKPYELKNVLFVYNAFLVAYNGWLFYEIGMSGWFTGYNWICEPMDYKMTPKNLRMANALWHFYFSKHIELLDTVLFVLRKKYNQVSTLHVIHHASVPISCWLGLKYTPMGQVAFFPLLNSFVHAIMYGYYFLSAFGPEIQKYLWWKKYITLMQMIQFIIVSIHMLQPIFINCDFPHGICYFGFTQLVMFFFLFRDFYIKSYTKNKPVESKND